MTIPKCILIADDNDAIRTATRHFLEKQSEFSVCGEATDGLDAIEKAQCPSPDLIVLDLSRPRMNGLEAARTLRAMSVKTPIILFTMYADAIEPQETCGGNQRCGRKDRFARTATSRRETARR